MLLPHQNRREKNKRIISFSFAIKANEAVAVLYLQRMQMILSDFGVPLKFTSTEIGEKKKAIVQPWLPKAEGVNLTFARIRVYDIEDTDKAKTILLMLKTTVKELAGNNLSCFKQEIIDKPLPQVIRPKTLNVKKMIKGSQTKKLRQTLTLKVKK